MNKIKYDLMDHPSKHGVLPFIFYPSKNDIGENYTGNGVGIVTIVKIAITDTRVYDANWMDDKRIGNHPLVPDIDLTLAEKVFGSEQEAIDWVREWWMTAKLGDYDFFNKGDD